MSHDNPFMQPSRDLLLSMSTCSTIADMLAERLNPSGRRYGGTDPAPAPTLPEDPAVLLDAEQVARILAVRRSTVFELARRRTDPLPSLSIGRQKRFERAAVEAWAKGSRRT